MNDLSFVHRGAVVTVPNVPPDRTLLQVLREDLGLTAPKEGCGEGDCGACTVVIAATEPNGTLRYRAVNSCIRLAHAVQGSAVWTAQDLDRDPLIDLGGATVHPVQQALVEAHASQCGFCTPGFAMSLFGSYQNRVRWGGAPTRAQLQADLSGNLCRCTGYRPILEAGERLMEYPLARLDEAGLREQLAQAASTQEAPVSADVSADPGPGYRAPTDLGTLLQMRARLPAATLVAGATDLALSITKGLKRLPQLLDVTRVPELRRILTDARHTTIGAAVPLEEAFGALVTDRPALAAFAQRFAGLPVRQAGTLGGNIANGSPIGDSMPLLLALNAELELMRWDSTTGQPQTRRLPLDTFYTGYRQNQLRPDELLTAIQVPRPVPAQAEWTRAYKVSKRFEDDISAVCLALSLQLHGGVVCLARVGVGGVAATPVRARLTEAALEGQPWTADTVQAAMNTLGNEFSPLSDLRASAHYRQRVLSNLLWRAWLEHQGGQSVSLDDASRFAEESV